MTGAVPIGGSAGRLEVIRLSTVDAERRGRVAGALPTGALPTVAVPTVALR